MLPIAVKNRDQPPGDGTQRGLNRCAISFVQWVGDHLRAGRAQVRDHRTVLRGDVVLVRDHAVAVAAAPGVDVDLDRVLASATFSEQVCFVFGGDADTGVLNR